MLVSTMLVFTATSIMILPLSRGKITHSTKVDNEALSNKGDLIARGAAEETGGVNKTEVARVKRSYGGLMAGRPPQWLQGMWSQQPGHKGDGHFAGLGIRLNDDTFLAHKSSCHAVNLYSSPNGKKAIDLRMGDTLNISGYHLPTVALTRASNFLACGEMETLFHGIMASEHAIFKYERVADKSGEVMNSQDLRSTNHIQNNPLLEKPQFQSDVDAHSNCTMYSYSSDPFDSLLPSSELRKFVKIPVEHQGCEELVCGFRTEHRGLSLCKKLSDVGSPIMCGGGNKISHVVSRVKGDNECSRDFIAHHLAPHYDVISKHIGQQ